jgi:hypothetical protein
MIFHVSKYMADVSWKTAKVQKEWLETAAAMKGALKG